MPTFKSTIAAIALALIAIPGAIAQTCGSGITYPGLQSSYSFSSTDTSQFCLKVTYKGCKSGQQVTGFLSSPDANPTCSGYTLTSGLPASGTFTSCCGIQKNQMNSNRWQAYFQSDNGGTASAYFSAYGNPDAGKCKNALQNFRLSLKDVKGQTTVTGYSTPNSNAQSICYNSQFSNPNLYINSAKIGSCSQADFTANGPNDSTVFSVQCTLAQAETRAVGQSYDIALRVNVQSTADGSTAQAVLPGAIKVAAS